MAAPVKKSTLRLARTAYAAVAQAFAPYGARTSRHDYTQAQHAALLVVRQHLRLDYRGLAALVAEWAELRRALRLSKVPHYSTLCYAVRRERASECA